jgi:hypothetical protein
VIDNFEREDICTTHLEISPKERRLSDVWISPLKTVPNIVLKVYEE